MSRGSETITITWSVDHVIGSTTSTAPSVIRPCMTPSDDHGFTIDETEVIHWGLCPDCSADLKITIEPAR